jgi:hypothetical protein
MDDVLVGRSWETGTNCTGRSGVLEGVLDLVEGVAEEAQEYIRERVGLVVGMTVAEALTTEVRDSRGRSRVYRRVDLRYDLRKGYLLLNGEWGGGLKTGRGADDGLLEFAFSDLEYADDTGMAFPDRGSVARVTPFVNSHFERWGMEVHEKQPSDTKVKSLVLFCAAPPLAYKHPPSYDNADLTDIPLPSGNVVPVVAEAKYLGSMLTRDGLDSVDVDARVAAATRAFGALAKTVFQSPAVSPLAKREAYVATVLSVLLYGCEGWCMSTALWCKLRRFHNRCTRAMCRVTRWHVREYGITTASMQKAMKLRSIETYVCRRQLQWAGHIARMGPDRLPRQFLTSWCDKPRTARPFVTYGATLTAALEFAGVDVGGWMELAQDRDCWGEMIKGISDIQGGVEIHAVLKKRAGL